MENGKKSDAQPREDDATDSRTLDEIEADEKVPFSETDSSVPSPDEGSGRGPDEHGDDPI